MAKENFECMVCDKKKTKKEQGYHIGICKECVKVIKETWADGKDAIVISDDSPLS
jgi:endogenous inhibitor of DNA gyrase (YacG/DUF329 family)